MHYISVVFKKMPYLKRCRLLIAAKCFSIVKLFEENRKTLHGSHSISSKSCRDANSKNNSAKKCSERCKLKILDVYITREDLGLEVYTRYARHLLTVDFKKKMEQKSKDVSIWYTKIFCLSMKKFLVQRCYNKYNKIVHT